MPSIGGAPAWAAMPDDDLASRFATAPESTGEQRQLTQVTLNGVDCGTQLIQVSKGRVTLPAATVRALGLVGRPDEALDLSAARGVAAKLDEAQATLTLTVPVSMLAAQRFAPDVDATPVRLSPETWGVYVDYDANVRHEFGPVTSGSNFNTLSSGNRSTGFGDWGGIADLRVLAPDVIGGFGYAYDSSRQGPDALVRLDSSLTWRPSWLNLAVTAGDAVSTISSTIGQARAYRFGGVQVGTDFSAVPGWSSSPIPSVTGNAQAQSAIDVYLDSQRTYHTDTAGGPFSLVLPSGSIGPGASVVVTDVTGRSVVIPVEVAPTDAQLLRRGLFLWSAGLGAPRFGYGASASNYDAKLYGYANARYGALDRLTATAHVEGGAGLLEAEGGADIAVASWLAVYSAISASQSARGAGGAGRFGVAIAGPWRMGLEAAVAHTAGAFDDVVSISGRTYSRYYGLDPLLSLPATSELSARLSWQPNLRLSLSASYEAASYKGSGSVGFASVSANYLLAGRVPVFANLSHAMGGQRETTLVVGVSFSLGDVQAAVSGGYGTGGGTKGYGSGAGYTGTVAASRPLGESVGAVGWNAYATRAPTGMFADASVEARTGYGVPGLAVQSFGNQATGYATLRGSAGVVGMHPFLSDPAAGGIVIADAGRPGVPVQLNGYDKGRTSFDGQLALPGAVAGTPQRVSIDTARLPIDAVPSETEQLVTVRDRGAARAAFGVRSASAAALVLITYQDGRPPVGSTLVSATSSAPVSKEGRAYLTSLAANEVLTMELPDGTRCFVHTRFDGHGGVGRKLGPLPCVGER